jgi:hypothetical protein
MFEPLPPTEEMFTPEVADCPPPEKRTIRSIGKRALDAVIDMSRDIDEVGYAMVKAGLFGEY